VMPAVVSFNRFFIKNECLNGEQRDVPADRNRIILITNVVWLSFCSFSELIYLFFLKGFPIALHNGGTDLLHKLIIEIKIMDNAKTHTKKLASLEEMPDIRARGL